MSTAIKRRRGTTLQHSTFTGLPGETTIDTDKNTVVVHDGSRAGGYPLARQFELNVKELGAKGDGTTDDTAAIQAAINLGLNGGPRIRIPAGTYVHTGVTVRGNNVTIRGDGAAVTILRRLAGSASANVLELGNTGAGNSATPYTNIVVSGLTLDGNKASVSQPSSDLTDWGLPMTACSNCHISDIRAINCWNGGVGVFINSNYNHIAAYCENCGVGNTGGGGTTEPGFDVNSSKYNRISAVVKDCQDGFRLLDNCIGNVCDLNILNPTITGVICGNQTVNESHGNIVRATVTNGASGQGMSIGTNFRQNIFHLTVEGITGLGVNDIRNASYECQGNQFFVCTRLLPAQSCKIGNRGNTWHITSVDDGTGGSPGDYFAVDVQSGASGNLITANVTDTRGGSNRIRGVVFQSGSSSNRLIAASFNGVVSTFTDNGTGNSFDGATLAWTDATLNTGWDNAYGSPKPNVGYLKDPRGFVHLRGNIKRSSGSDTVMFTLPAGLRPSAQEVKVVTCTTGTVTVATIDTDGTVNFVSGTAADALPLGGIVFPVA